LQNCDGGQNAVIITPANRAIEKVVARFFKPDQSADFLGASLDVGVPRFSAGSGRLQTGLSI